MTGTATVKGSSAEVEPSRLLESARAVLFDLDGTLIDTHIDFAFMRREVVRLATEAGVLPPLEEQTDILGLVEAGRSRLLLQRGAGPAVEFQQAALRRLEEIEVEQCASPQIVAEAAETVAGLRAAGKKIAIVTRNSRAVSERLVREGMLVCDILLTRDDVERTKPDPDHLLVALKRLGADGRNPILPREAVMVGDHWMDVLAGRRAGCRTIGLLRGRDPSFFQPSPPDVLVDSVADLRRAGKGSAAADESGRTT